MSEDVDGKQNQKINAQIQAYLNAYTVLTGMAPGDVFYVSSVSGSASYPGNSVNKPRATIESCFTAATVLVEANKGDIIFALPGHVEAVIVAGGLDLDIAGVTIYFLGDGASQAKITFGTGVVVGADMDIDAASITLVRPKFVASIDALTGPIDVNAADFTIIDGEYFDDVGIDTTDAVVAVPAAIRLKILGYRYYAGDEAGTQKDSHIQLNGVDDAILRDIDIRGDFDVGNIENVTDEVLNIRLKDIFLENLNADPSPAMLIDTNATGLAENVKIRIESGTTYVSNVGKINWWNSHGANADGYDISDPIGTAMATGLEAQIAVIDEYHDVATADTSDNAQMRDVIGNKTDAAAAGAVTGTESVMAYAKQVVTDLIVVDGLMDVPVADTSDNAQIRDVVGNKTDAAAAGAVTGTESVMAYAKQLVTMSDSLHADRGNYITVTADMTQATWNTVAAHEIAEVTGMVRMRIVAEATASLAGTPAASLIALGTSDSTAAFLGATTAQSFAADDIWSSATAANNTGSIALGSVPDFVVNAKDVGYTISGAAGTEGTMVFHIWWEPVDATGAVVAGTGGTFA